MIGWYSGGGGQEGPGEPPLAGWRHAVAVQPLRGPSLPRALTSYD
jgi:hypothetical protein